MSGHPAFALRALSASYGRGGDTIRELDLSVAAGEVVGLLGANGAGKSTTLRAVSGTVRTSGEVLLDGRPLVGPAERRARLGVAHVPEGRQLIASMSVRDNLLLGRHPVPRGQRDPDRLDRVLELFPELRRLLDRAGGVLSGGEQQMVAIGRALMSQPRVLLLDEPTMGLAPIVVERLAEALRALAGQDMAVLVAEENLPFAGSVAPSCHVLQAGRIAWAGPTDRALSDPDLRTLFLG